MAVVKGRDGVVKVGAATLTRVQSWEFTIDIERIEITAMGDSNKKFLTGDTEFSGSLVYHTDSADSAQDALVAAALAGTEVTLELYDDGGTAVGKNYWTGPAVITSVGKPADRGGVITTTVQWASGDGDWAQDTVEE